MPYSIQGNPVSIGREPFLHEEKHYIPLREVVEALGGTVTSDGDASVAHATIGPWEAVVATGDRQVEVTGRDGSKTPVLLSAPAYAENDALYVPYDFLYDAFGYEVRFSEDTLNIVNPNAV